MADGRDGAPDATREKGMKKATTPLACPADIPRPAGLASGGQVAVAGMKLRRQGPGNEGPLSRFRRAMRPALRAPFLALRAPHEAATAVRSNDRKGT